jgi:hypothetical protein
MESRLFNMAGSGSDEAILGTSKESRSRLVRRYWNTRHLITNGVMIFLAGISAYLQYAFYPSILNLPPYLETSINLHLAPFLYSYDAMRCTNVVGGSECQTIIGVPSLDFFQIFSVAIILWDLFEYYQLRKQ